ncbi:MAG: DUF2325 domain-containing protein [Polyangiaceae bacterium]|nr:DUF2325 domain-containing protein [Polyangiaceae bacterium]MCW5790101.1 DUF2325 domain-containing protein [Polyangiaceae bacterium]
MPEQNHAARSIGVVGGHDRSGRQLAQFAKTRGHRLHHHTGNMAGTGERDLQTLVERSDLVVVITDVNSHAAVKRARVLALAAARPCVLVRRLGIAALRALLEESLPAETELPAHCSRVEKTRAA